MWSYVKLRLGSKIGVSSVVKIYVIWKEDFCLILRKGGKSFSGIKSRDIVSICCLVDYVLVGGKIYL